MKRGVGHENSVPSCCDGLVLMEKAAEDIWSAENSFRRRCSVSVPVSGVEEFRTRLEFAMEAILREVVGPDSAVSIAVEPAEESDGWLRSRDIDDLASADAPRSS